jgi:hypothetical protein
MEADVPRPPDIVDDAVSRLCEALAILETIDAGNLLAELPADPTARAGHQRAVSLLSVLRRELTRLKHELQAADQAQEAIARALTRFGASRSQP